MCKNCNPKMTGVETNIYIYLVILVKNLSKRTLFTVNNIINRVRIFLIHIFLLFIRMFLELISFFNFNICFNNIIDWIIYVETRKGKIIVWLYTKKNSKDFVPPDGYRPLSCVPSTHEQCIYSTDYAITRPTYRSLVEFSTRYRCAGAL